MSRPRPKNQTAIGREVARMRRKRRPWKAISLYVETEFGVSYGRTRLYMLANQYLKTKSIK